MEFSQAWNPLRSALENDFSFNQIKQIVSLAGLDLTGISHLEQKAGGGASKGQLITGIDRIIRDVDDERKQKFIEIVAEEVIPKLSTEIREELESHLGKWGLGIAGHAVVPLKIFDPSELAELPLSSRDDMVKAAQRFRDGDSSGAVSAACGAVDAATSACTGVQTLATRGGLRFKKSASKL